MSTVESVLTGADQPTRCPARRLYRSRDQKDAGRDEVVEYLPRITLQQPVSVVCLKQR